MAERIVADYDGPWKEALRRFFPAFLAFFFAKVYADIDWRRKFEFLDKELQKIVPGLEKRTQLEFPAAELGWVAKRK
jgi:hypothetical protein